MSAAKLCTATSKRTHLPCRANAVTGFGVCYHHGGKSLVGVSNPQWKTGRYSKHLPQRLLPRYHEALQDQAWASLRSEISLLDSRISELVAQLDSGEAGSLWAALTKTWQDVTDARSDGGLLAEALTAHGDAVQAGATEQTRWAELARHIEQRRGLVESERKRVIELRQVITGEQAAALFAALTSAIKRHVTDRRALAAISVELSRLAIGQAGQ